MNQHLLERTEIQGFNRKTGFTSGGRVKKVLIGLILLFVGVNLLVIVMANLFNILGK